MEAAAPIISNVAKDHHSKTKSTEDLDASPESSNADSDYVTNSPAKSTAETASPAADPEAGAGVGAGAGRGRIEEHHFENRREIFRRIETMKPEVRGQRGQNLRLGRVLISHEFYEKKNRPSLSPQEGARLFLPERDGD